MFIFVAQVTVRQRNWTRHRWLFGAVLPDWSSTSLNSPTSGVSVTAPSTIWVPLRARSHQGLRFWHNKVEFICVAISNTYGWLGCHCWIPWLTNIAVFRYLCVLDRVFIAVVRLSSWSTDRHLSRCRSLHLLVRRRRSLVYGRCCDISLQRHQYHPVVLIIVTWKSCTYSYGRHEGSERYGLHVLSYLTRSCICMQRQLWSRDSPLRRLRFTGAFGLKL